MKEFKYYENLFNKYKNKIKENEDKDSKIFEKFLQIVKNLLMIILKLFNYSYKIKLFLKFVVYNLNIKKKYCNIFFLLYVIYIINEIKIYYYDSLNYKII